MRIKNVKYTRNGQTTSKSIPKKYQTSARLYVKEILKNPKCDTVVVEYSST